MGSKGESARGREEPSSPSGSVPGYTDRRVDEEERTLELSLVVPSVLSTILPCESSGMMPTLWVRLITFSIFAPVVESFVSIHTLKITANVGDSQMSWILEIFWLELRASSIVIIRKPSSDQRREHM